MATIIAIAMIGLFFPEKIQSVELKVSEVLTFGIPNPFVRFLESDEYLRMVRLFGAVSLLMVSVAEYYLFLRN
jgi:hypothetical protein